MPYGYAPYDEASAKAQGRMSVLGRIGEILAGAGQGVAAVRPGVGPFGSALTGFSRSYIASNAAKRAAEEYAMKQQQAQEDRDFREIQKQDILSQIEARGKRDSVVPKPEPVPDWARPAEEQAKIIDFQSRLKKATATTPQTGAPMSDEALNQAADLYATTGQMPGFGLGATPDRAAVRNRAAMRHPGTDIASNRAEYQKNQKTMTNAQNLRDLSGAWENTVIGSGQVTMDAYYEMIKSVPEANNMPLNYLMRHGAALAGNPAVAAFNTARETFKNEVARLLNQPGGTGGQVLSDAARKEVERIVSGNLTGRQLQASFAIIRKDALNKRTGYDRQIEQIRSRIRTRFGVSPDLNLNQQPEEQGVLIYNPETGNLEPAQ